jgi:NADH dehydrogenase (ubiquinone) 1 beta subcomplex subunit 8
MSGLLKISRIASKIPQKSSLGAITSIRHHWNKDFKPGKFPETEKEREQAAKKYGLTKEDYKPFADDGNFSNFSSFSDCFID